MPGLMNDWELAGSKNRWVPPSDRHLALRAKLKTGWSVRTASLSSPGGSDNGAGGATTVSSPGFGSPSVGGPFSGPLSDAELEQIKRVLARAEEAEKQEQERVGKLVDKLDRMKRIATGNGATQCMLCGAEFGLLGPRSYAAMCHDCRKYVCQKNCGVDTVDVNRHTIFLCKICSESRETWKKSGAWFYHGVPKFVLPSQREPTDQSDGALTPNWAAGGGRSRAGASPNGDSPERRGRIDSSGSRRRLPATPDFSEYRAPSPQPRWAQIEANRRTGVAAAASRPAAPASPSRRTRRTSSSSGEDEDGRRDSASAAASNMPHQWHGGVQRIVTRCRRFTESSSSGEERSEEEPGGPGSERSPSLPSTPRGSVQTPSSTHDINADGAAPTLVDTSDSKSIDSGVVRSERSHSVTRPASLVPSSPSSSSGGHQSMSLIPSFPQPVQQSPQSQSAAPSIGRSSETIAAAASTATLKESISEEKPSRANLNLPSNSKSQSRPSNIVADLPSSPDDEQSSLGTLEFALRYDGANQTLTVFLIRAKNLKAMDSNGFSDPYVKLHLLPGAAKSTKLRTKTIHKTLNPEWNETLVYYGITEEDRQKKTLRLSVMDEDRIGSDFLGESRVPLKRLSPGIEKAFNVYLEKQLPTDKSEDAGEERGKILVGLSYHVQKQCLTVEIVRCVQLIGMDPNGYSDPYVKIALRPETDKKHKAKTKTRKKSLNPEYNETFSFPVTLTDLSAKTLDITVWDKDVGKHDDFIGGVQLGIDAKGDRLRQWYDCLKNPGSSFQRWHKLSAQT